MGKIKRFVVAGVIAAAAAGLAACSGNDSSGGGSSSSAAPTTSAGAAPAVSGVTSAQDVFGPACSQVPTTGAGSLNGMVSDPVATAAGNNPLLTKLTAAVKAADLGPTLNNQNMQYTVFAPADAAFDALPAGTLDSLLAPSGKQQLSTILTLHVAPKRMDKNGLLQAKTIDTVQGGTLTIGGSGDTITVTDPKGDTANVLCGNIPTANATVFVIDKVLMPAS